MPLTPALARSTSLDGAAEQMGDLKSVVLHEMNVTHVKSSFPMSLGARITGVDDKTYSSTGESFSAIVLPHAESTQTKKLQADDVSLGKRRSIPPDSPSGTPATCPANTAPCAPARSLRVLQEGKLDASTPALPRPPPVPPRR